jgi:hypothetical protein
MNKWILQKFGVFKDQDGIMNRYLREAEAWNGHLKLTREFILKVAENKPKSKVCILGSGWLLDVPFQELSEKFSQLGLIDIKHPVQIKHKLRNHSNISFMESDITGLIEPVYYTIINNNKIKARQELADINPQYDQDLIEQIQDSDYVVSVNLLNQLDILICDYLLKSNQYSTEEINGFRKKIQANHIDLLPKNKSALITDYMELNLDDNGQVVNQKQLIYTNFPENIESKEWIWEFDLQKTYHKNLKTVFKVSAIEI